jgi:hypothetical protein
VFFKDADKLNHRTRAKAFEDARQAVAARYPEDTEATILYALVLSAKLRSDRQEVHRPGRGESLDRLVVNPERPVDPVPRRSTYSRSQGSTAQAAREHGFRFQRQEESRHASHDASRAVPVLRRPLRGGDRVLPRRARHRGDGAHARQDIIKAVAAGEPLDGFGLDRIDEMNARHSKAFANCTKAETVELLRPGVPVAAAAIRALSDAELDRRGVLAPGMPPMSAEQIVTGGLLNHIDEHFGSIRKTVGH